MARPATKPLTANLTLVSEDFFKFPSRALEDEYTCCSGEQRAVSCYSDGSHGAVRGLETSPKELVESSRSDAWCHASATVSVTSTFFWVVMQRTLVVTDVSGQSVGPISNVQSVEDGNLGCPETSVTNYQCTMCNNSEEHRYHVVMMVQTQTEPNQNLAATGQDSEFLLTGDGRNLWVCVCLYRSCTDAVRPFSH